MINKVDKLFLKSFPLALIIIDKKLKISYNNRLLPFINNDSSNMNQILSENNTQSILTSISKNEKYREFIFKEKYETDILYLNFSISKYENNTYLVTAKDITAEHKQNLIQKCCYLISEAIYSSDDLDTLFREIHLAVSEITNTDNFYISLVDINTNTINFPYFIDKHDPKPNPRKFKNGLTEFVIKNEASILLDQNSYDLFLKENNIKVKGKKCLNWLGVPLKLNNNKTIGMVGIQSYKNSNKFTQNDLKLLELVSNQIATAIKRKKDDIFIHKQAHYDPLTGLTNKTLFYDRLDHAILQAQRHDEVIAVLFLDIDDFKNINDSMGHTMGDELLKIIGNIIKASVRKSDTVSRWGGDEFSMLLPNVKTNDGVTKLCTRILNDKFKDITLNNKKININASIGISFYPMDGDKAETLIDCADKAMYLSKKNGKNQYSLYRK